MRQRPLAQRNSLGPHVGYSATGERPASEEGERREKGKEGAELDSPHS